MNTATRTGHLSQAAKRRLLAVRGEPLFLANWDRAVFIHYEVDADVLQRRVPFGLDLYDGRAFVSLVAFTLAGLRPRQGGFIGELLFKPIATHEFLNVRTYVHVNGEPGIYFLAEWLSNALSVPLGPPVFGLPYQYGRLRYQHANPSQSLSGRIEGKHGRIEYRGRCVADEFTACEAGSLNEFLLERYTAFTKRWGINRLFRVWHQAWPQARADLAVTAADLLTSTGEWWTTADYIGANYSPGVNVWMGRPLRLR